MALPPPTPTKIFINYRRHDAGGHAGRLHEYPSRRFGDDCVFFDRSTIESGDVFPDKLRWGVEGCAVLLALIGPEWLDFRGDDGGRRLDGADDFVRQEIALALEQGKKVIPVLFDDTPVPSRDRLPDPLKALANCDAHPLRGKTYEYQTQRRELVRLLAKVPGVPQPLPEAQEVSQADPNRERMLTKVRRDWIDGHLKDSLHNLVRIELGLEEKRDAVSRPWDLIVQQPDREPRPLPPGQAMGALFDELGQALLILGAPGSGKTTLLLELARDLLDQAAGDATHPIPVVFHLSTWAERRRPLADWLVDELCSPRYYVPRKLAQEWANAEQVLPLLDGLDEVAPEHRDACVEALNAFRRQHPLVPLAVCSRAAEYEELRVRLELSGAVFIRPLSREQIGAYLKEAGKPLAGVRTVLRDDETLWELLETPLMLSIVALTYQGWSAAEVRATGSPDQRRTQLFANYTQRMFERRTKVTEYTLEQTMHWLTWLADTLMQNNLSIFYVEWMQPEWLPSRAQRWIVAIVPITFLGLGVGLFRGLVFGLGVGLVVGRSEGLVVGLVSGLAKGLAQGLVLGLAGALVFGLAGGLIVLSSKLESGLGRITPAETLRWSWRRARRYLIRGLVCGGLAVGLLGLVVGGLFRGLVFGLGVGLAGGLAFGLIFGLLGGLTPGQIATRTIPNEGIRRSLRHALISFLTVGLLGWLLVGLFQGLGESVRMQVVRVGLLGGLVSGLVAGLINGGSAVIKHYVLRVLLWRKGCAPLNYVRFLDYAAERVFLYKVGGGYIFMHRLLMEYFASLTPTPASTESPPAASPTRRWSAPG